MSKNKTILNIYILEDNPDYLTFIQETVQQYLLIEELPAKIRLATTSTTELLAAVDWSAINDSIFLLDIELGDSATSGVDVATAIRKKSYYVDILFITSHVDEALRILEHKIAPLDMINKNSPSKTEKKIRNNILYARRVRSHLPDCLATASTPAFFHLIWMSSSIFKLLPASRGHWSFMQKMKSQLFPATLRNWQPNIPTCVDAIKVS